MEKSFEVDTFKVFSVLRDRADLEGHDERVFCSFGPFGYRLNL